MKELIVLAADKSIQQTIEALLARPDALGIRPLARGNWDIVIQPQHDASLYLTAHEFLRPQSSRYRYALTVSDRHGSGRGEETREEMERSIEDRLAHSGWNENRAAVVIDPELEVWVWSDSPQVEAVVGWKGHTLSLRHWLAEEGYLIEDQSKPLSPQECLAKALRKARKPRSSSLFRELAEKVSFRRCTDPAFGKLCAVLREWFPRP